MKVKINDFEIDLPNLDIINPEIGEKDGVPYSGYMRTRPPQPRPTITPTGQKPVEKPVQKEEEKKDE